MLAKAIFGLLAASAAVMAAPAVSVQEVKKGVEVHKTYAYRAEDNYGGEKYGHDNYDAEKYGYDNYAGEKYEYDNYGGEKYGHDNYDVEKYGYDNYAGEKYEYDNYDGNDVGHENVYAREIVCPAVYKVVYMSIPVKCDCKTETRYEKPADIELNNVTFEKEYKGYDIKGY
ncbi:hypothetical protein SeMB42_g06748 [Synchytrium endobioticum]|uniref:Uncharacterized protein n=1 Tax=Synchytrium endobioticum TaxID=286115 RepID=A0A507CFL8_9FUNG|nr:hypothetical protein SeMB42_g06748 [Synchytrium endobioticum]